MSGRRCFLRVLRSSSAPPSPRRTPSPYCDKNVSSQSSSGSRDNYHRSHGDILSLSQIFCEKPVEQVEQEWAQIREKLWKKFNELAITLRVKRQDEISQTQTLSQNLDFLDTDEGEDSQKICQFSGGDIRTRRHMLPLELCSSFRTLNLYDRDCTELIPFPLSPGTYEGGEAVVEAI